jgi:hypothetical protein
LTKSDADACGFEITSYDFWVRSWKGYQLVMKLLLSPSYGVVISNIVNGIQQSIIGQYNDVGYLLSLTATMRALLYVYSSSLEDVTIDTDITVYKPALMTKEQCLTVIQQLWLSFKDKFSYNRQQEYIHYRSKFPVVRHKPYSGKVIFRSPSPSSSRGRKVEFGVAIYIIDLAKHYNVKSNLESCKADCPYTHYNPLSSNLTTASVLSKAKRIIGKLNLTDEQSQLFLSKIEADSKFK